MSKIAQILDCSLARIGTRIDEFSSSFYDNLLETYPEFKSLFEHANMAEQKKMLAGILILVMRNWQKPQLLASTLKRLGGRHVKYGAVSEYYPLFGRVLLTTFAQYLGSDWTAEIRQAWIEAFESVTELMLEGYREEKAKDYLQFSHPCESKVFKK